MLGVVIIGSRKYVRLDGIGLGAGIIIDSPASIPHIHHAIVLVFSPVGEGFAVFEVVGVVLQRGEELVRFEQGHPVGTGQTDQPLLGLG